MVADAVRAMAQPGATLRKVVVSRPVEVHLDGALSLSAALRRLRAGEPNCTIFSMPVPDGSFFGASPELLVARHGTKVSSHPLAGTVPRGDTARADADAQRGLAGSTKNRAEHRYVVDAIATVLTPFCRSLSVPTEPSVVTLRSVAHLGTRIEGRLHRPVGVLELLEQLHPTPAVGGTPRPEALAFIEGHEAGPRGHWAGPVGWVGAGGDGEWMIGIRSAAARRQRDNPSSAGRRGRRGRLGSRRRGRRGQREAGHRARCGGTRRLSAAAVSARAAPDRPPPPTCVAASGILTTMVAPPCGDVATAAVPWRASAMARTMARPSPVPDAEREGSPW